MTDQPQAASKAMSKSQTVEKLLKRPCGATMPELMTETGWQNHSVRAFLSDLRKKGLSLAKEERKSGEVAYRLGQPKPDEPSQAVIVGQPAA